MLTPSSALESLRRSPLFQAGSIFVLLLLLQIPIMLIYGLFEERDGRRADAVREVSSKWGGPQEIVGPFVVVPYRYFRTEKDGQGVETIRRFEARATFLAEELEIEGALEGRTRHRGIYEVPVYRGEVTLRGRFAKPSFEGWDVKPEDVLWDRAVVTMEISDARALRSAAELSWGEEQLSFEPGAIGRPMEAGAIGRPGSRAAVHAKLPDLSASESTTFEIPLEFNGSSQLRFAPLARQTTARLSGDWPDPSFQGAWLPTDPDVGDQQFNATWSIPHLGRNYPQRWIGAVDETKITLSLFGVDLLAPVDAYRQTERTLKYEALFLALTFTPLWLFEVVGGLRLHFIQYALIGAALCLFYLLELSLAEHIGFGAAYWLAAAMIVGLVTAYGMSTFHAWSRAMLVGGLMAGFYAFLYVLIQLQDYALAAGSLGLFALLAALMYATRGVDWFSPRGAAADPPSDDARDPA